MKSRKEWNHRVHRGEVQMSHVDRGSDKAVRVGRALDEIIQFVEIDIPEQYRQRILGILRRLMERGYDPERYGAVHYDGYSYKPGVGAWVERNNNLYVGQFAGYEDWRLELTIVHEFRHQEQNSETWDRIARAHGLDPGEFPLKRAMALGGVTERFVPVLEAYNTIGQGHETIVIDEIDAYVTEYKYLREYLEDGLVSCQRYEYLHELSYRVRRYLDEYAEARRGLSPQVLTEDMPVVDAGRRLLAEIDKELDEVKKDRVAPKYLARSCGKYFGNFIDSRTGHLSHPDGSDFTMSERLIWLQAAYYNLRNFKVFGRVVDGWLGHPGLAEIAGGGAERVDDLLDRQTFGLQYLLDSDRRIRAYYRNDSWHTTEGMLRAQHLFEADIGDTPAVRAGHDIGWYFPFTEHLYFKLAPLAYLGLEGNSYNPDDGVANLQAGIGVGVGLGYDVPISQSLGASLAFGYSLGAAAGTEENSVDNEIGLRLEIFRY